MIIKKYRADSIEEGKKIVEEELGLDAIILTTRPVKEKGIKALFASEAIEVTAAVGEEELARHNARKQKKATTAVPATGGLNHLGDNLSDLKKVLGQFNNDGDKAVEAPAAPAPITYGDPRYTAKGTSTGQSTSARVNTTDMLSISAKAKGRTTAAAAAKVTSQSQERRTRPQMVIPKASPEEAQKERRESMSKLSRRLIQEFGAEEEEEQAVKVAPSKPVVKRKSTRKIEKVFKRAPASTPKASTTSTSSLDLDKLRAVIREEFAQAQKSVNVGPLLSKESPDQGGMRFLISKGILRSTALKIEAELTRRYGPENSKSTKVQKAKRLNALKDVLATKIKAAGPILLERGTSTIVALVGPTGVGKTTTLMKLASQYSKQLKKKVAVISADYEKLGAKEQVEAMAKALGIRSAAVENKEELDEQIAAFSSYDLIFVDTGGRSQYDWEDINELGDMLSGIEDLKLFLTVSATTKDVDVYGIIKHFSILNVDSLIFTKLDETIDYGLFVNVCEKMKIPISYLTAGRRVPQDLKICDGTELARKILVDHNAKECQKLRELAAS